MPEFQNFSILVADDDVDDQFLIHQAITEANLAQDIKKVYNGLELMDLLNCREPFKHLAGYKPDLVILDLNMPMMDGLSALIQIRNTTHLKNMPVYVLSTSHASFDRERSLALGANGFYSKPAEFSTLKNILLEICASSVVLR